MIYRVIGLMSGSSLDGLDISYSILEENGGKWQYEIVHETCVPFTDKLRLNLENIQSLSTKDFVILHTSFGRWMGEVVNQFIEDNNLAFQVALVASHGHTAFHFPELNNSVQIGCGATLAAITSLPVVCDLRMMDVALGGQGAPIVPIAEKLLFSSYSMFLNIGGISNITYYNENGYFAYDICSANRVLNTLCKPLQIAYDKDGLIARKGKENNELANALDAIAYYGLPAPKSLSNEFSAETIIPIIESFQLSVEDNIATYTMHIARQIAQAIISAANGLHKQILITGGGAFNTYLLELIQNKLSIFGIELIVPDAKLVQQKESLAMALIGVLRWREDNNVLSTVTGASRDSIGGALYMGSNF